MEIRSYGEDSENDDCRTHTGITSKRVRIQGIET